MLNFQLISLTVLVFAFGKPLLARSNSGDFPPVQKTKFETQAPNPVLDDLSKADADGPHVFYRGGRIWLKKIERRDTALVAIEKSYSSHKHLPLMVCNVPELAAKFSFPLRKELKTQPDQYPLPKKMLVVSDIEGNFGAFRMMLQGAKVIDKDLRWSFGDGHLVCVGDFFDRGLNVTEVLWLIYKLETEAEEAGGKIHFIIGNHEVLNLEGITQYVRNKYIENAKLLNEPYENWYSEETELGRWLRTKNAIEKIGDYIFCHGGISPSMYNSGLTINQVNNLGRKNYGTPTFEIKDPNARKTFDPITGIYWFRGIARKQVEASDVNAALEWAGGKKLIIGHTLMPEITALYGGKVFCVDLYHDENYRLGFSETLWVEDGQFFVINNKGEKNPTFAISF